MVTVNETCSPEGPRVDEYHRRELPGPAWRTCRGCPALRVHDWHYFYCRRLGDQSKEDVWFPSGGWHRFWGGVTWKTRAEVPCDLPTIVPPTEAETSPHA